jgi:hypothetical protein
VTRGSGFPGVFSSIEYHGLCEPARHPHVDLRHTFAPTRWGGGRSLAQPANSAQLRFQRGFKHTKNEVFGFFAVHGGLLSMRSSGLE